MPNEAVIAAPGPGAALEIHGDAADAGQRLDRVLQRHLPELSVPFKQLNFGRRGHLRGRGATRPGPRRVQAGQQFAITVPESGRSGPAAQPMPLGSTSRTSICSSSTNRPAWWPSARQSGGHAWSKALLEHCGASLPAIGGVAPAGDRASSSTRTRGLLVVAKTEPVHRALSRDFAGRRSSAPKWAFVWACRWRPRGEISGNSAAARATARKMAVVAATRASRRCPLRVERRFGNHAALIECRLLTGRTHQNPRAPRAQPAIR